ncbi:Transthyretin-like family protein [Aphelenchoides besseyi]|nr:Transthyretin-like family protein [Aphelenchoides besseyi]
MIAYVLFCVIPVLVVNAIGSDQAIAAQGRLFCHDKPAAHVSNFMMLMNPTWTISLRKHTRTRMANSFLEGYETELTKIDPKLNIYTDCDDSLPCQRKISIKIPDKYISDGTTAKNVFDAVSFRLFSLTFVFQGELNLAGRWKGEERDCFHFMRISNQIKLKPTNSTEEPVEQTVEEVYETTYSYE